MKEYRLVAWPQLRPPFDRIAYRRMLSDMSHRHMSVTQLAECSGIRRHEVRAFLMTLLRLDENQLRVVAPDVGGGFGAITRDFSMLLLAPESTRLPLDILVANILASFVLGLVYGFHSRRNVSDEFSLLIQKYPNSRYNEDARARMMDLRNRVADNEMHVVDFYTRRGAWLAAAKRAEQVIAQYPGAPATLKALKTLERSYRALGLTQEAEDAARTLAAQTGQLTLAVAPLETVAAPAAAPAAESAPTQHQGFFSRFAGLFSGLDQSKKQPIEVVLPSASSTAAPSEPAKVVAGEPAAKSNRLIVEYNTGEEAPAAAPTPAPASEEPAKAADPAQKPSIREIQ